jgi:hypothetical protein
MKDELAAADREQLLKDVETFEEMRLPDDERPRFISLHEDEFRSAKRLAAFARNYLASAGREDDGELADDTWGRSVGLEWNEYWGCLTKGALALKVPPHYDGVGFAAIIGFSSLARCIEQPTRRQFRQLAAALGIELREGT